MFFRYGNSSSNDRVTVRFAELQGGCVPKFQLEPNLKLMNAWFSECTIEAAMAKIKEDKSKFATDTMECLNKMSPLSLKVTYKQVRDAAKLEIFDCFNVDYRIALKMMTCGDFIEGQCEKKNGERQPHYDQNRISF